MLPSLSTSEKFLANGEPSATATKADVLSYKQLAPKAMNARTKNCYSAVLYVDSFQSFQIAQSPLMG